MLASVAAGKKKEVSRVHFLPLGTNHNHLGQIIPLRFRVKQMEPLRVGMPNLRGN